MQLTQGLHRSLQQNPDRVATVFRGRRRTYREFSERVARLAGALQGLGMAPGDRVGMLALNSDRYLEYAMATWWGGGVMNPVNIRWSVPEIVYSLDDCDTRILIVDDHFRHLVDGIRAIAKHPPVIIHAGDSPTPDGMLSFDQLIAGTNPVPDSARSHEDLAIIMYTGGTTGQPKGVEQTHMSLWCGSIQRMADMPPLKGGKSLHASPFFHIAAFTRVVAQFIAGEQHVIVPMFDAAEVLETIERERVTEIAFVPTMIGMLIQHPDFKQRDLSSVRRLGYGASPFNAAVLERTLEQFPGVEFVHSYGLTETMIVASNPPENHDYAARERGMHLSVGRVGYGLSVRIIDRHGDEVPRGTVGELVVRGASVARRYWNKPEETAQAMRNGWMHTGDGAYMDDDGYIFIVDRIKDMIVSGGENVYSAEVENAIGRHAAVAMCAAIGIPSKEWGEAVHAVVVLRPGASATEDDIRQHCRKLIAGYKCPKSVEFRTALPLSGAGKVLKRELRAPYWTAREHGTV